MPLQPPLAKASSRAHIERLRRLATPLHGACWRETRPVVEAHAARHREPTRWIDGMLGDDLVALGPPIGRGGQPVGVHAAEAQRKS